jgi:hypothetical protein
MRLRTATIANERGMIEGKPGTEEGVPRAESDRSSDRTHAPGQRAKRPGDSRRIDRPTLLRTALVLPLLTVGLVSFILVRSQQGEGDALLAQQQQTLTASVDRVLRAAPDPNNPYAHVLAITANCTPLGGGQLRNPWRCVLRYPKRLVVQYRVTISADGKYLADHEVILAPPPRLASTAQITGCCIVIPGRRSTGSP